tara:strand:+ start:471 stop:1229 length:759 start_codon:yes stop_codon:yes gene_type:complete
VLKLLITSSILISSFIFNEIKLYEIDTYRSISDPSSQSIIENGTSFCNDFFDKNKKIVFEEDKRFKNFFLCKFSVERNRFYVYMLSQTKDKNQSIKESCIKMINRWPWISDHMDKDLSFQAKDYLKGFFIENIYNNRVLSFSNNLKKDSLLINNEIDNYIIEKRKLFTEDNLKNNEFVQNEINKINRIYKKILSNKETDLEKIIKVELNKIVRYKIFVNDVINFKSYSCNWQPGKGLVPYVKREKFSEFEDI